MIDAVQVMRGDLRPVENGGWSDPARPGKTVVALSLPHDEKDVLGQVPLSLDAAFPLSFLCHLTEGLKLIRLLIGTEIIIA